MEGGRRSRPILVHQISAVRQSGQGDVGFVLWPSSVYLARYLTQTPAGVEAVSGKRVVELGCGCGVTGLAVALLSSTPTTTTISSSPPPPPPPASVTLTDFNDAVVANAAFNLALNDLSAPRHTACRFDFYASSLSPALSVEGSVDTIIAADVVCCAEDATALASALAKLLSNNRSAVAHVVFASGKHRFGVDDFPREARRRRGEGLLLESSTVISPTDPGREQLFRGAELTAGYDEKAMTFVHHRLRFCEEGSSFE